MRAKKLIKYLEDTLSFRWKGKKFEDMLEVYSQVKEDVDNIVAEHGLKFDNWRIQDIEDGNRIIHVKPIYNQDKRSKYKVKGRMIAITFDPTIDITENETIEDLVKRNKKISIEKNIERLKLQIEDEKKELQESEQALEELEKELKTLA